MPPNPVFCHLLALEVGVGGGAFDDRLHARLCCCR